jgi:hypothetical protein
VKNKEAIYDAEIYELMDKVLKICQREGIAMVASFAISSDEDPDLMVTSLIKDETGHLPEHLLRAYRAIRGEEAIMAMIISEKPKDKVRGLDPAGRN